MLNKLFPYFLKKTKTNLDRGFLKTATEIHNFVRRLSPIPETWIVLNEKNCKIYQTEVLENLEDNPLIDKNIGEYWIDNKNTLWFKTGEGILSIKEIQM